MHAILIGEGVGIHWQLGLDLWRGQYLTLIPTTVVSAHFGIVCQRFKKEKTTTGQGMHSP